MKGQLQNKIWRTVGIYNTTLPTPMSQICCPRISHHSECRQQSNKATMTQHFAGLGSAGIPHDHVDPRDITALQRQGLKGYKDADNFDPSRKMACRIQTQHSLAECLITSNGGDGTLDEGLYRHLRRSLQRIRSCCRSLLPRTCLKLISAGCSGTQECCGISTHSWCLRVLLGGQGAPESLE